MSVINIVVPPPQRRVFSGGIFCIFQYAKGLAARGHEVNILPLLPSPAPSWAQQYGRLLNGPSSHSRKSNGSSSGRPALTERARELVTDAAMLWARLLPHDVQRGFQLRYVRQMMRDADVTLATSFETALPVHLYGSGRRCYFLQHFEPYFAPEMPNPQWAEHEALASYRLGLKMIANSAWLQGKVADVAGSPPVLCPNAVEHEVFYPGPRSAAEGREIRVISYGGRNASWKGFQEMAAAVRRAREALPQRRIRWLVYGQSLLPPDNDVARYEPLGFLQPKALAQAYRSADILLSASWFESFPLFPLEAMACRLAVVTTQIGTEEFAIPGQSAEVVQPRDVESIAGGLCRVIEDRAYRETLARNGHAMAQRFSWTHSVERMESLLLG